MALSLKIINRDNICTNTFFIIYFQIETSLKIYIVRHNENILLQANGNISIFIKLDNDTTDTKWISMLHTTYFKNINIFSASKISIQKNKSIKKNIYVDPINIIDIINPVSKIYLYDHQNKSLIEEHLSTNIYTTIDALYKKIYTQKKLHAVIINTFIKYLKKITNFYYDSNVSVNQIEPFIEEYGIDFNILEPNEKNKWKCFNDFFSRNINMIHRPIIDPLNLFNVYCPTDSRVICFKQNSLMQNYVSNPKFIFSKLESIISNGSSIICRLSPEDYHHFHSPMNSQIESILILDLVTASDNILNDNIRVMLKIKNIHNNVCCYYCIIGSSFIGSVKFFKDKIQTAYTYMIKNNTKIYTFTTPIKIIAGEDLGTFLYGGSTVVMIFDHEISFIKTIQNYSTYDKNLSDLKIESYCNVRSILGTIA